MNRKNENKLRPPLLGSILLKWILNKSVRDGGIGDLHEKYILVYRDNGRIKAWLWYWFQVFHMAPQFVIEFGNKNISLIGNYLRISWRNTKRYKGFTFINIFGLALGIACATMIFLWVDNELSYDTFHDDHENKYRIIQQYDNPTQTKKVPFIPGKAAQGLRDDFPDILVLTVLSQERDLPVKYKNQIFFEERHIYADRYIFNVFKAEPVKGSLENSLSAPGTAVITESIAKKYFGDTDPLGKTLRLGEYDYNITTVIKDSPPNTHVKFGIIASINTRSEHREWMEDWEGWAFRAYIKLTPEIDLNEFSRKLKTYITDNAGENNRQEGTERNLSLERFSDIHLNRDVDFRIEAAGDRKQIYIFSVIGIMILLVACLNFINLSTARSFNRSKEVGIRKAAGAVRTSLIKQFFLESVFLTFISSAVSLVLIFLCIPWLNSISGKQLTISPYDLKFVLFYIIIILITGILSGSYPSVFLSRFDPVRTVRNQVNLAGGKNNIREILVIFQFAISIGMIISTLMLYRQLDFMKSQYPGFNKEQKLVVKFPRLALTEGRSEVIKNEFLSHSDVKQASASSGVPGISTGRNDFWLTEDPENRQIMLNLLIDHDFIPLFNIKMKSGHNFPESMKLEDRRTHGFLINEAAVSALGLNSAEEAVGKTAGYNRIPIIGVTENFHYTGLQDEVEPTVMSLTAIFFFTVTLNIQSEDLGSTISFIKTVYNNFYPDYPFEYFFLDQQFDMQYKTEEQLMKTIGLLAMLGISIACLGLFGLAAFMIESRIKEIGIRKTLGATSPKLILFISIGYLKWIVLANIFAWPAAYLFIIRWLESYANRASIKWDIFILSGLAALFIGLLTVIFQSIQAANTDPVKSLRCE